MPLLFVYGTLRKGGSANHLMKGATWLGRAQTVPGYALDKLEELPGMYKSKKRTAVLGDMYMVTDEQLRRVDAYEDSRYHREIVMVETGDTAWAYLLPRSNGEAVQEDWS